MLTGDEARVDGMVSISELLVNLVNYDKPKTLTKFLEDIKQKSSKEPPRPPRIRERPLTQKPSDEDKTSNAPKD